MSLAPERRSRGERRAARRASLDAVVSRGRAPGVRPCAAAGGVGWAVRQPARQQLTMAVLRGRVSWCLLGLAGEGVGGGCRERGTVWCRSDGEDPEPCPSGLIRRLGTDAH